MAEVKISDATDVGTVNATDKVPLARAADTTAYAAQMSEVLTYIKGAIALTHTDISDWSATLTALLASPSAIGGTVPAAGTFTSVRTTGLSGPTWTSGVGAPGSTTPVGSLYSRSDGAASTTLYLSAGGGSWTEVAPYVTGTLTAPPAIGGTTPAAGTFTTLKVGTTSGPTWTAGTGAPGSTQPLGSLYSRTDGGVGTTLYVSRGGGTWNPVAAV